MDTGPERRVLGRDPGKLFLPVAQSLVYNYTQANLESHLAQSSSLPHCVCNVIHVRKNHSTFGLGTLPVLMTDHEPVLAFTGEQTRSGTSSLDQPETVLSVFTFSHKPIAVRIEDPFRPACAAVTSSADLCSPVSTLRAA